MDLVQSLKRWLDEALDAVAVLERQQEAILTDSASKLQRLAVTLSMQLPKSEVPVKPACADAATEMEPTRRGWIRQHRSPPAVEDLWLFDDCIEAPEHFTRHRSSTTDEHDEFRMLSGSDMESLPPGQRGTEHRARAPLVVNLLDFSECNDGSAGSSISAGMTSPSPFAATSRGARSSPVTFAPEAGLSPNREDPLLAHRVAASRMRAKALEMSPFEAPREYGSQVDPSGWCTPQGPATVEVEALRSSLERASAGAATPRSGREGFFTPPNFSRDAVLEDITTMYQTLLAFARDKSSQVSTIRRELAARHIIMDELAKRVEAIEENQHLSEQLLEYLLQRAECAEMMQEDRLLHSGGQGRRPPASTTRTGEVTKVSPAPLPAAASRKEEPFFPDVDLRTPPPRGACPMCGGLSSSPRGLKEPSVGGSTGDNTAATRQASQVSLPRLDVQVANESAVDSKVDMCCFSPRAYQVLTCDGDAENGEGILQRLDGEVRKRALDLWRDNGDSCEIRNWLEAERSIIRRIRTH